MKMKRKNKKTTENIKQIKHDMKSNRMSYELDQKENK